MDLSIIIVAYNSYKDILRCLNSISIATQGIKHEILIIDNNSTDQTKSAIKKFSNPLKVIENKKNLGFAKAVNIGLKNSAGEFCLLINPDVFIKSDSLRPMIEFVGKNPKIGICGCKLLNDDNSHQYSKGAFLTLFSILFRKALPQRMRKYHLWGYDKVGQCDWVTGAFMLIRQSLIKEVGYFDDKYFVYYEDMDYCLQAKKYGWQTYYYPKISAYHRNPFGKLNMDFSVKKEIQRSRLFFYKKNNFKITYYILHILTRTIENGILYLRRKQFGDLVSESKDARG